MNIQYRTRNNQCPISENRNFSYIIGDWLFLVGYSFLNFPVGELTETINVISKNNNTFVV
jgi:hypothetical protein